MEALSTAPLEKGRSPQQVGKLENQALAFARLVEDKLPGFLLCRASSPLFHQLNGHAYLANAIVWVFVHSSAHLSGRPIQRPSLMVAVALPDNNHL